MPLQFNATQTLVREYASCKISDVTLLGLVTIEMSEPVTVLDSYDFLTIQDFELEYRQNSDEDEQDPSYQIVSVTESEIKI